ncbi:hypothetical protein ACNAN0_05995 [Agrilactobacillus fermenti]|uniref:hypothetical protein n=1 Tax=Agrilactobacillus fermenti TaxID=2586909 RepID=UPI001E2CD879|nr:hypothetical protein [Agrilactobacillus fermenti]MCD2256199.1 hypothetical protein [Agrilactobacillus fermenti]
MRKKFKRKQLKQTLTHKIYFYLEFANGQIVEMPLIVSENDDSKKEEMLAHLRSKKGSIQDSDGHLYDFSDLIHYEIYDEKDK